MPKVKLPYDVKNSLDSYVTRELGERMSRTGTRMYKENVMDDIARHAGVGVENIKRINRNVSQPSIGVAIKIADYFHVNVEDIFKID